MTIVNPKTLMEHKNPALTALEIAGRDLLRYTQEFGLTPAAELIWRSRRGLACRGLRRLGVEPQGRALQAERDPEL